MKSARGAQSVRQFAAAMVDTLNLPKNAAKGGWDGMSLGQLAEKLTEEFNEVMTEIEIIGAGGQPGDLAHEAVDLACVAMMLREWAIRRLIQEAKTL